MTGTAEAAIGGGPAAGDRAGRPPGRLLRTLAGEPVWPPPLWLMRQAGRYLPEYRALRTRAPDFLAFCYDPSMAVEATLQPIRRYGFDASIVFSDILVIPDALGQPVRFEVGEGPRLEPLAGRAALASLAPRIDLDRLAPVYEAVRGVRAALPAATDLIGFCGAPFTLATYMVAGKGTKDQGPARLWAYRDPEGFSQLIDRLTEACVEHLALQVEAGADAVQVFDSWAGALPEGEFDRWCLAPLARIVEGLRARCPGVPVIAFPRGASRASLARLAALVPLDALSLDTTDDLAAIADLLPGLTLQGNLDPVALAAGGAALEEGAARVMAAARARRDRGRGHVVNLGHGILPETPLAHVERLIALVRAG